MPNLTFSMMNTQSTQNMKGNLHSFDEEGT